MVGEKKRGAKKVGVGVGGCFAADAQSNAKEREPEWVGSQRRAPMHRLKATGRGVAPCGPADFGADAGRRL